MRWFFWDAKCDQTIINAFACISLLCCKPILKMLLQRKRLIDRMHLVVVL